MNDFVETNTPASNATPTDMDALQTRGGDNRTEAELLDALKQNTEFLRDDERPLPTKAEDVPAPEDIPHDDDQDIPVQDEDLGADVDEDTAGEDATATQNPDVYTLDDLDDIQITHKVDGEDVTLPLSEWVKNSAIKESLDGKGRELGNARKALDEERAQKIGEIDRVLSAASSVLVEAEHKMAQEYHSLEAQIVKAREDDDDYLVNKLKDQREVAQQKYWNARNEREAMVQQAAAQKNEIEAADWNQKLQHFQENITTAIPDWNEETAGKIRQFALDRGIPEAMLSTMVDIDVIKFVDDFRRVEEARASGSKKREAAPVRHTPVRKSSPETKQVEQDNAQREKVLSGSASLDEENAFLRNLASRHF